MPTFTGDGNVDKNDIFVAPDIQDWTLNGLTGNDKLTGAGGDELHGGGGINTVSYLASKTSVIVTLGAAGELNSNGGSVGGIGSDAVGDTGDGFANIIGSNAKTADVLTGNALDNTIEGGLGSDTLVGGGGSDTASYANSTAAVTVSLALQGAAQNTVGAGSDTLTGFANLTGGKGNDILTGDAAANQVL